MSQNRFHWLLAMAWLFVAAVTMLDVWWAVEYSSTAEVWEANPLMRWVMMHYGVWVAVAVRLATVAFAAALMPMAPRRSQVSATLTLMSAHVYLAYAYAAIIAAYPGLV